MKSPSPYVSDTSADMSDTGIHCRLENRIYVERVLLVNHVCVTLKSHVLLICTWISSLLCHSQVFVLEKV